MFLQTLFHNPVLYISWVVCAAFSICVHEYAHAYTAVRFGDETPRDHLTLNPLVQMGPISLAMLVLVGVAWGAVPVDPRGTGSDRKDAMISFAGPLANLILCALFALLSLIAVRAGQERLSDVFYYGGAVNGALCAFNLIPVPPLDGFSILRSLVPKIRRFDLQVRQVGGVIFLLIWLTPLGDFIFMAGHGLYDLFAAVWAGPVSLISGLL